MSERRQTETNTHSAREREGERERDEDRNKYNWARSQRKHNFPLTKWIYIHRGVVYLPFVIGCSFSFPPTVHKRAHFCYCVLHPICTCCLFENSNGKFIKISVTNEYANRQNSKTMCIFFHFPNESNEMLLLRCEKIQLKYSIINKQWPKIH